jgi:hypothetical protein
MQRAEQKEYFRHSDGYPVSRVASDSFEIRRATVRDADVVAWHRARMFQDMGDVSGNAFENASTTGAVDRQRRLHRLACDSDGQAGNRCWRRWGSVAIDPATPGQCIDNWRRPIPLLR